MDNVRDIDLSNIDGFDWDEHNINKNKLKHGVDISECEEVFYNKPQIVAFDKSHSQKEDRYSLIGNTTKGKRLTIIFTLRNGKIRVISARAQSNKERKLYDEELRKK